MFLYKWQLVALCSDVLNFHCTVCNLQGRIIFVCVLFFSNPTVYCIQWQTLFIFSKSGCNDLYYQDLKCYNYSILSDLQERPKSALFPVEVKSKMSVEEQIDRIKRHQSGSMKENRRSLQLPPSQQTESATKPAGTYRVVSENKCYTKY